ncbi:HAD family hydrolase [Flavobacterium sp. PL12]|uniref:HAD family hydrolase n=1 Tax=Flavobacterium sp. PL12 TaxID=3071718 RepID=UPI00319E367A
MSVTPKNELSSTKIFENKTTKINNLKCIIFDCDGILVDSESIANQVLLSMAEPFGLKISMEEAVKKFNGRRLNSIFEQIEILINKKLPESFETEFRKRTFEAFKTDLKPIKGVKEFIDSLNINFCVASSGPVEKITLNLTTTGLIEKFENKIFSSYQINSWKPEPETFLHACKQRGFEIEECVVIEDSVAGVIAAVKGGFKVYGLANENNAQDLINEGATVFYSYEELAQILNIVN